MGSGLADRIAEQLALIEDRLLAEAHGDTPFVTEAAAHIIAAGGKRFRPGMVVTVAALYGTAAVESVVKAALAVELTHVASLYHDDVMDEAELRRGTVSANRRFENTVAILVGDFLFARASGCVADLGAGYVKLHAETFSRLVQGQIGEVQGAAAGVSAYDHYLRVIADKTASLISTSAVYGGMVSGAPAGDLAILAALGDEIGTVFQLSDDLLDITSTQSGKTPGTDLREGVLTLPTLLVAASADPADARLQELIGRPLSDEAEVAEALGLLREHAAMGAAREEIARRAAAAETHLDALPAGEANDALRELCRSVVSRSA
ncbi:polyprenyl synthetase family protein [Propionicicella superfundia]|uniref:polyprenyl synthetase family protein n=1 Tax=Propionicicella superfundia TaxID=348582 RepID=UPI00048A926B|nr:polyprenyl synthetase family protein [Propionicicella superfundia]